MKILNYDAKSFGEVHNIYHITNKLQPYNMPYYENLFEEHLMAYSKSIHKNDMNIDKLTINMALKFITQRIRADIETTETLTELSYQYLEKLIGITKLKSEYGIDLKRETLHNNG